LAKATQHSYLFAWRRFLGFLAISEREALEVAPHERLTIERVRSFRSHLAETNSPRSVANQIHQLYLAARMMMPECDWTWLKAVKTRLFAVAPAHAANGPVITSLQLLDLGELLMDESKPAPDTPIGIDDAIRYRDGLMIALVAFVPIRRKNLAALEIGRHLVRDGESWSVVVSDKETKARKSLDYPVPELLEPYLATYLTVVRPQMRPLPTCAALWLNTRGGTLAYGAIGDIIARHLTSHFGFRVTLHDARDAAMTLWAISVPDQIGVARDLLAHSDLRTSTRHYNRAKGIEASRAYRDVIAGMRRKQNRSGR
jgi:integrase